MWEGRRKPLSLCQAYGHSFYHSLPISTKRESRLLHSSLSDVVHQRRRPLAKGRGFRRGLCWLLQSEIVLARRFLNWRTPKLSRLHLRNFVLVAPAGNSSRSAHRQRVFRYLNTRSTSLRVHQRLDSFLYVLRDSSSESLPSNGSQVCPHVAGSHFSIGLPRRVESSRRRRHHSFFLLDGALSVLLVVTRLCGFVVRTVLLHYFVFIEAWRRDLEYLNWVVTAVNLSAARRRHLGHYLVRLDFDFLVRFILLVVQRCQLGGCRSKVVVTLHGLEVLNILWVILVVNQIRVHWRQRLGGYWPALVGVVKWRIRLKRHFLIDLTMLLESVAGMVRDLIVRRGQRVFISTTRLDERALAAVGLIGQRPRHNLVVMSGGRRLVAVLIASWFQLFVQLTTFAVHVACVTSAC